MRLTTRVEQEVTRAQQEKADRDASINARATEREAEYRAGAAGVLAKLGYSSAQIATSMSELDAAKAGSAVPILESPKHETPAPLVLTGPGGDYTDDETGPAVGVVVLLCIGAAAAIVGLVVWAIGGGK